MKPTFTVSAPAVSAQPVREVADPTVRLWSAPAPHFPFMAERVRPASPAEVTVIWGV